MIKVRRAIEEGGRLIGAFKSYTEVVDALLNQPAGIYYTRPLQALHSWRIRRYTVEDNPHGGRIVTWDGSQVASTPDDEITV